MKIANAGGQSVVRMAGRMLRGMVHREGGRAAEGRGASDLANRRRVFAMAPYIFLCMLTLAGCWLFVGRQGIFGVKVDWLSQHSVFPDYFRQQFYETRQLFPEFAGSIGGGQNIYHFSYYGLYNPIYLFSYLLPFVKMGDYLMVVSAAGIFVSAGLIYYWLDRKGFSREISLPVSVLFLFAGPVIFHSCHQVMFVNYMPFLIMALLGVDRYFEKGRSGLYALGVFFMILTSFYFSIGGMLVLVLYGLEQYMRLRESSAGGSTVLWKYKTGDRQRRGGVRALLKDGIAFLLPMLAAVLMSGFLLVPAAYAILGKRQGGQGMSVKELFIPELPLEGLVHGAYGIGFTTGIITLLITGLFYRRWSERTLYGSCLFIFTVPIFQWLLNGGLYVRGKVLIPFLPLICYMTAVYLEKQKNREIPFWINAAAHFLTVIWLLVSHFYGGELSGEEFRWYLITAESILLFLCFIIYWQRGNLLLLTVPSALCLFLGGSFFYSGAGGMLDENTYGDVTDIGLGELSARALAEEDGFWRMEQLGEEEEKSANLNRIWNTRQWISSLYSSAYNTDYQNFRKDIFGVEEPFRNDMMQAASDNPLYQKLMGIKYLIGDAQDAERMAAAGYQFYLSDGEHVVYRSENTAPVAYASSKVIGERDYNSLEFPCNQTALMKYAVVTDSRSQKPSWKSSLASETVSARLSVPETDRESLIIDRLAEDSYYIQAKKKESVSCTVNADTFHDLDLDEAFYGGKPEKKEPENGKLFFLQFQIKNHHRNKDAQVWVNGVRNKLSAGNHAYYNGNTTFTYVVPLESGVSEVQIAFGKGEYELLDMECFLGDSSLLEEGEEPEERLYQSPIEIDWERTKGNRIQGKLQVQDTGYLITSIPYDDGFEIFVDGKRTLAEKVNQAFLGCSIGKGEHQIELLYHAPGVNAGKELACVGLLLYFIIFISEKNRNNYIAKRKI